MPELPPARTGRLMRTRVTGSRACSAPAIRQQAVAQQAARSSAPFRCPVCRRECLSLPGRAAARFVGVRLRGAVVVVVWSIGSCRMVGPPSHREHRAPGRAVANCVMFAASARCLKQQVPDAPGRRGFGQHLDVTCASTVAHAARPRVRRRSSVAACRSADSECRVATAVRALPKQERTDRPDRSRPVR